MVIIHPLIKHERVWFSTAWPKGRLCHLCNSWAVKVLPSFTLLYTHLSWLSCGAHTNRLLLPPNTCRTTDGGDKKSPAVLKTRKGFPVSMSIKVSFFRSFSTRLEIPQIIRTVQIVNVAPFEMHKCFLLCSFRRSRSHHRRLAMSFLRLDTANDNARVALVGLEGITWQTMREVVMVGPDVGFLNYCNRPTTPGLVDRWPDTLHVSKIGSGLLHIVRHQRTRHENMWGTREISRDETGRESDRSSLLVFGKEETLLLPLVISFGRLKRRSTRPHLKLFLFIYFLN